MGIHFIGRIDDTAGALVDFGHACGILYRQALKVVVQVRQVGQRELGLFFANHHRGCVSDPFAARQSRVGAPKRKERKRTKLFGQITFGVIQDVKNFRTIAAVVGFGRSAVANAR